MQIRRMSCFATQRDLQTRSNKLMFSVRLTLGLYFAHAINVLKGILVLVQSVKENKQVPLMVMIIVKIRAITIDELLACVGEL